MTIWGEDLEPSEKYLYHYTGPQTLARILLSHSLRMGPYSATRDPRENGQWFPSFYTPGPPYEDVGTADMWSDWVELDRALRQRAKVACLTMDRESEDPHWSAPARGWGRARMWEQYAARHSGAVLVFDFDLLSSAAARACGSSTFLAGTVKYTVRPWETAIEEGVPYPDLRSRGPIPIADELIKEKGPDFFFTKDADWQTETEYRFITVDDREAVLVDLRGALLGLALGADYPDYEIAVLPKRLELAECPDVSITQVRWRNGYPVCEPLAVRT